MSIAAVIGQEIDWNQRKMLVVRIIQSSLALFQNPDGSCYTIDESYVELRGPYGEVEFITLMEDLKEFKEKKSEIKALDPLTWRIKR